MLSKHSSSADLWYLAGGYLCLHAFWITFTHSFISYFAYLFFIVAPALACAVCLWRARSNTAQARFHWLLLSGATLLWTIAVTVSGYEIQILRLDGTTALTSDLIYFLYGVPILLAISSPTESPRSAILLTLDGIQVAITALITYVAIFSALPFSNLQPHPNSGTFVADIFFIENLVLALAATLRLIALPQSMEEEKKRFYQCLCSFLWIYALIAGIYNSVASIITGPAGLFISTTIDIPFLLLAILALRLPHIQFPTPLADHRSTIALFIDTASPILFPLVILVLGIVVAREHFVIGVASIAIAIVVFGVQSTVVQILYQRTQLKLKIAHDRMEAASLTDGLTGVANRRQFDRALHAELNRTSRHSLPFALLLIDIDYFKLINDTFGHSQGDICLRRIAHALAASLRESDLLARYGGEEFAAILPATDEAGARTAALRMQEIVYGLKLPNRCPLGEIVTISIGTTIFPSPDAGSADALIAAADRALYRAKQNGRNRVEYEHLSTEDSFLHL